MTKHDPADFDDSAPLVEPDEAPGAPKFFNDAEILGKETPAFKEALGKEVTFLTGELWGQRDRRNTLDEKWQPVTMPLVRWIDGAAGTANTPAFGLSRHPEVKHKEGTSFVLGSSIAGARKAKAMDTMFAMGLDIDSGAKLDDMLDKIEQLGLFCLVYTSHSHGKSGLQLKHEEVIKKLKIKPSELNLAQVQRYLREHSKERYEEDFILKVEIVEEKKQVKSGVVIDLKTPPLDKFRLIFPLAEPVKLVELADTQSAALDIWENKITGLATEMLGVHFDTSCTDPSRLFFLPRHPKGAKEWYSAIIQGDPLRFEDVPEVKKSAYAALRRPLNPFEMAGGVQDNGDLPPRCVTPSGASLNDWHSKVKDRFQMADLVEDQCSDRIRVSGGEAQGHVHIECPFEHEHSEEGGTATMVINALDSENGYWTWFCHHDSCQSRHKLEFVQEALAQGWFSEDELFGDSVYMMEGADEEDEESEADLRDKLLVKLEGFDANTTEAQVRATMREALADGADESAWGHFKDAVATQTKIGKRPFDKMRKEEARKFRKPKGHSKSGIEVTADFPDQVAYAQRQIQEANEEQPRFFQFGGTYAVFDKSKKTMRLIESRDIMFAELYKVTSWEKTEDDNLRLVPPPEPVVRALFGDVEFAQTLPELAGVVTTPFFDKEGQLVETAGFNESAGVYLAPFDFELPGVSREPSEAEVREALRLIVEEVLADFPLGGMTRNEIMSILNGEHPTNAHAVAHTLAMVLLPFCREMIAGPTPGHVFNKPVAGTGASALVDRLTTITGGAPAPSTALPTRQEEIGKTLSSMLAKGGDVLLFDNVGQSIASAELASAMTSIVYQARLLGRTELVTVPVRGTWVFTANNIEASGEILRRFVIIPLDRMAADPEFFVPADGWRHPDLKRWVEDHRGELVHACLTIIQNWIAQGMPRAKLHFASFENWAGVMGGILHAAQVPGFLEGQEAERAKAADGTKDGVAQLVSVLAEYPSGTIFRPGGAAPFQGQPVVSVMDVLNGSDRADDDTKDLDPIQINGWGYSDFDGAYTQAGRIGRAFKTFARKPYRAGECEIIFEEVHDTRNKTSAFRMVKRDLRG